MTLKMPPTGSNMLPKSKTSEPPQDEHSRRFTVYIFVLLPEAPNDLKNAPDGVQLASQNREK